MARDRTITPLKRLNMRLKRLEHGLRPQKKPAGGRYPGAPDFRDHYAEIAAANKLADSLGLALQIDPRGPKPRSASQAFDFGEKSFDPKVKVCVRRDRAKGKLADQITAGDGVGTGFEDDSACRQGDPLGCYSAVCKVNGDLPQLVDFSLDVFQSSEHLTISITLRRRKPDDDSSAAVESPTPPVSPPPTVAEVR